MLLNMMDMKNRSSTLRVVNVILEMLDAYIDTRIEDKINGSVENSVRRANIKEDLINLLVKHLDIKID